MEAVAYSKRITLTGKIEDGIIVRSKAEYCERICNSLLDNAIKYEPEGGEVSVSLARERKKVVLSVCNPGSVIPEREQELVFSRFYRGDQSRSEITGYGLGLPIARKMCEHIGATISVRSEAGRGTEFRGVFPN